MKFRNVAPANLSSVIQRPSNGHADIRSRAAASLAEHRVRRHDLASGAHFHTTLTTARRPGGQLYDAPV